MRINSDVSILLEFRGTGFGVSVAGSIHSWHISHLYVLSGGWGAEASFRGPEGERLSKLACREAPVPEGGDLRLAGERPKQVYFLVRGCNFKAHFPPDRGGLPVLQHTRTIGFGSILLLNEEDLGR